MDKKELRRQIREQKRAMTEEQIESASRRLGELFFESEQYKNLFLICSHVPPNNLAGLVLFIDVYIEPIG